jgi:hypothetical protein
MIVRRRPEYRRGLGDFSSVASVIQTVEGWFPGSTSYRNNNPGNLKYAGQAGAIGQDANGFAIFPDYQTGYQALLNQISLDASRGESIAQFTAKYAPAQDANDPASYAATIASATGLSVNDPLASADTGTTTTAGASFADLFGTAQPSDQGTTDNSALYWGLGLGAGALLLVLAA